ncbi:MAG: MFS transporter [Candidatus Malihini olakiniferum]
MAPSNFEIFMNDTSLTDNIMTPRERRATWGLGIVVSLRILGMFMVLPVLMTYGMTLQDASESLIGIAIGIYGLMQALFQVPFGLLSDRVGCKPLIIIGLLIFVFGSLIAALTTNIWGIILGRALQGAGAISAAVMALLSDLTREQNRTKAMAFIGISFGVTFAIAIVISPIVAHAWGLQSLFWFMALLASLGIVITLTLIPNAANHAFNRESAIVRCNIRYVLSNSRLVKLNVGIMCLHILLMSIFVALPHVLEKAGLHAEAHWKVYLYTILISFIGVLPFIIYAEVKRQIKPVFVGCIITLLAAEIFLWIAGTQLWPIVAGVQLFFLAFNIMEALLPSLISKEAPAGYKGTIMGVYSTTQFIGVAIGGSMGGTLLQFHGAAWVFAAGALLCILWLILGISMKEPPYLSSLRITLPELPEEALYDSVIAQKISIHPGVVEAIFVPEERSAYVKIDCQKTSRQKLEALIRDLESN